MSDRSGTDSTSDIENEIQGTDLEDEPLHYLTLVLFFPDVPDFRIAAISGGLPSRVATSSIVTGCFGGCDDRSKT